MMTDKMPGLSDLTLSAIRAESIKAETKHHENYNGNPNVLGMAKRTACGEEVGEVDEMLTYDKMPPGVDPNNIAASADRYGVDPEFTEWRDKLVKEQIQASTMYAAWAESVDRGGN
jgi:hypothetical protein